MTSRLDRAVKTVWLVIGLLLLLGLAGGAVFSAASFFGGGGGDEREAPASSSAAAGGERGRAETLPVRYGQPETVQGSPYRLVRVYGAPDEAGEDDGAASRASSRAAGVPDPANVLFLGPGDADGRMLLDHPARVEAVEPPLREGGDPSRPWITYRIAMEDTDGDGRLGSGDRAALFASTLGGDSLRRVLPDRLRLVGHSPFGDGRRLVVLALEVPADTTVPYERWRQRAFLYDVPGGVLRPYATLDSLAALSGAVLSRR